MIISRLPSGGGSEELHGASISVTLDADFIGRSCQLKNASGVVIETTTVPSSRAVLFTSIMTPNTYTVSSYLSTGKEMKSQNIIITAQDVLSKTAFSTTIKAIQLFPFATATNEQIGIMLQQHYDGLIDISTIADWATGSTRNVAFNGVNYLMEIVAVNHHTLTTNVGIRSKSAVTLLQKEYFYNGILAGNGESSKVSTSANKLATWATGTLRTNVASYYNQIDSGIRTYIKSVNNKYYDQTTYSVKTISDTVFIPSASEVWGTTGGNNDEGAQYSYFTTPANRLRGKKNGVVADLWATRSYGLYTSGSSSYWSTKRCSNAGIQSQSSMTQFYTEYVPLAFCL